MIVFEFALDEDHALGLGHITVQGAAAEVTTKGRTPDASMMLFLSIGELLTTVDRLLSTPSLRAAAFGAIGSAVARMPLPRVTSTNVPLRAP